MATKSPGIYFETTDLTGYTNPKSTTGTIVAVVGYAKKGPIGVPTNITSWADYKSTFGSPLDGYYSGLAVKNVLNAGGQILFTRVADASASPSNYVIKNPVAGQKGHITFSRNSDILVGTAGYANGKVYTVKASTADGDSKVFFVRSPLSGKLTQNSVLSQILEQNSSEGTSGTWEGIINPSPASGLYSFSIEGTDITADGDFYVNLTSLSKGKIFTDAVSKVISTGANATCILQLSNAADGIGTAFTADTQMHISGDKKFKIVKNGNSSTITISLVDTNTYADLANKLNAACNAYGVSVFIEETGDKPNLVFVLTEKSAGNTLAVKGLSAGEITTAVNDQGAVTNTNNLFVSSKLVTDNGNTTSELDGFEAPGNNGAFSAKVYAVESKANGDNALSNFTVSYIESTNSMVLTNVKTGAGSKISLKEASHGDYLAEKTMTEVGSIEGQDYLPLNIYRDSSTKKIVFESSDTLDVPSLENAAAADYGLGAVPDVFADLLAIEKDPSDYNSTGADEAVKGSDSIDASNRDMVIITSKESGSATNNIVVEHYSVTSPIQNADGTYDVRHDLTVKVDGALKETYEDISLDYADVEKRFDTVINESPENGGSSYITVAVVKNDFNDADVQLPDGVFYIGKANKDDDEQKAADVDYTAYNLYDYAVGTDGIPADDGDSLFIEAMQPGTSALANSDLYDFHVIITPDDISENVQSQAIALCEDRGDAVAIIDPPIGLGVDEVIKWHNGRGYGRSTAPTSNYAMTYWPWCKVYDNSSGAGKYVWVMPSVVMAAKYVTVDKTAGSWYAPAGETNGQISVADIEMYPNRLDRDNLYVDYNRVNPICKFKDGSIVVYGEKTLQRTNSVLTKIHTRRMLVQIIKQCRTALRGYIFMPNTTDYLGKISGDVTAILETYKAGGGLNYYKIVCDETNNPTEMRQQDMIQVDVALVPEGVIETINFALTLNRSAETVTVS